MPPVPPFSHLASDGSKFGLDMVALRSVRPAPQFLEGTLFVLGCAGLNGCKCGKHAEGDKTHCCEFDGTILSNHRDLGTERQMSNDGQI